jgi:hypothetical protein
VTERAAVLAAVLRVVRRRKRAIGYRRLCALVRARPQYVSMGLRILAKRRLLTLLDGNRQVLNPRSRRYAKWVQPACEGMR